MVRLLLIGAGGFIGSVTRFLLGGAVQTLFKTSSFPYGTIAVNLVGCFVIGFIAQLGETRGLLSDYSRSLVIIGILGGFTTFSAFGNETINLLRDGQTVSGLVNVMVQVGFGLLFVLAGRSTAIWLWR